MKVTILGTGTSQGVPVVGCDCEVCQSPNPKDQRLRPAALIENGDQRIIIDIGPDFRQQMLRADIPSISAILLTHEHNDHMIGLDDVRPYNFKQGGTMPLYARASVARDIHDRFGYVFAKNPYPGAPRITLHHISNEPFFIDDLKIIPIESIHGRLPIFGYRIGDFTYMTDAKYFERSELEKINGSKVLILSALHHREHHAHLNLSEALELIKEIDVEQVYLTHCSHLMGLHDQVNLTLPAHVQLAYDGLELIL